MNPKPFRTQDEPAASQPERVQAVRNREASAAPQPGEPRAASGQFGLPERLSGGSGRGRPGPVWLSLVLVWGLAVVAAAPAAGGQTASDDLAELVRNSGVPGGLVVHLFCGDGRDTVRLRVNSAFVVQGLDTDAANVRQARSLARSLGLSGTVSFVPFDGRRLPYVDNLVNVLVAERLGSVPQSEVLRVLVPGGVAFVGGRQIRKPWPSDMDQWTHFWHGPDNNAVARDTRVGPPRHMQWVAGPTWTRHHHADKKTQPAVRTLVSAAGRLYYMVDEAGTSDRSVPGRWFLVARDAFNGLLLWKRSLAVEFFPPRLEELWRTVVADGDRLFAPLAADGPLCCLDGATGRVLRTYDGTERVREVVKLGPQLFVVVERALVLALDARSGRRLWSWNATHRGETLVPLTLAASEGRVFFRTDRAVYCLSAESGHVVWRVEPDPPGKRVWLKWPRERLIVSDDVVLVSHGGHNPQVLNKDVYEFLGLHPRVRQYGATLSALAVQDGHRLWQTAYYPGLESDPGEIYVVDAVVWLGPDFAEPRDLHTGRVLRRRPVIERLWTDGHHYRCYPGKATCRYVITAKRGVELIDLRGQNHSRNNWVRATCRVGVLPCNGLLYAGPHSCGCYVEAKLRGFWALSSDGQTERPEERAGEPDAKDTDEPPAADSRGSTAAGPTPFSERLQKGPAFGFATEADDQPATTGWWTYRGDAARSGRASTDVAEEPTVRWSTAVGARPSAPVVTGGRVFVADVDAHTVVALDATTGRRLWQFTAGARVDSPPTVWRGLVLFGSHDGWVYCLRSSDGQLVWRFRAAPQPLQAVAYEQLESVWPVPGSVLVVNRTAYVVAGRSSYLDGGLWLFGLEPTTGRVQCWRRLHNRPADAPEPPSPDVQQRLRQRFGQNAVDYKTFQQPDHADAFSMDGALPDVLTAEGSSLFLRQLRFTFRLERVDQPRPHLFATSSFLDGSEHHRQYWVYGTGDFRRTPVAYPWIVHRQLAVPFGLLLVLGQRRVYAVQRPDERARGPRGDYKLLAAERPREDDPASLLPDFAERTGARKRPAVLWSTELPLRPRALLLAADRLVVAGTPLPKKRPEARRRLRRTTTERGSEPPGRTDQVHASRLVSVGPRRQTSQPATARGVAVVVEAHTGRLLSRFDLPAAPVWDGLAACNGRLFVSLRNGQVVCLQ